MQLFRGVDVKINKGWPCFWLSFPCFACSSLPQMGKVCPLIYQCQWVIAFLGVQSLVLVIGRWRRPGVRGDSGRGGWEKAAVCLEMRFYLKTALNPL